MCSAPIGKGDEEKSDGVKKGQGRMESVVCACHREGNGRRQTNHVKSTKNKDQSNTMLTHPSVVMIGLRASFFRFLIEPALALSPLAGADAGLVVGSVCGVDCAGGSSEEVAPFIVGGRGSDCRCKRGRERSASARRQRALKSVVLKWDMGISKSEARAVY